MRVSMGRSVQVGGGGGGDMAMMYEDMGAAGLLANLPLWLQGLIITLLVIIIAAIVGWIIGKMYASVKYPDPEKQSVIPPILKIVFLVVLIGCGAWLYSSLTGPKDNTIPVDGMVDGIEGEIGFDDPYDGKGESDEFPEGEIDQDDETAEEAPDVDANPGTSQNITVNPGTPQVMPAPRG